MTDITDRMTSKGQEMPQQLLSLYVKSSGRYRLLFSVESAEMAEIYCAKHPVDLILMEITGDGENGPEAAEQIRKQHPGIKIMVATSVPEISLIRKARQAGVDGFWYKEFARMPAAGRTERPEAPAVHAAGTGRVSEIRLGNASGREFTDRELEVLRELTSGATNTVIAEHLYMSASTVKDHISHMLEKTGFQNRTELAVRARESGLVVKLISKN